MISRKREREAAHIRESGRGVKGLFENISLSPRGCHRWYATIRVWPWIHEI